MNKTNQLFALFCLYVGVTYLCDKIFVMGFVMGKNHSELELLARRTKRTGKVLNFPFGETSDIAEPKETKVDDAIDPSEACKPE